MSESKDNKVPLYTSINKAIAEHGKTLSVDLTSKILDRTVNFSDVEKDLYQRLPIDQVNKLKEKIEQAQKHGTSATGSVLPSSTYNPASTKPADQAQSQAPNADKNKLKPPPPHIA